MTTAELDEIATALQAEVSTKMNKSELFFAALELRNLGDRLLIELKRGFAHSLAKHRQPGTCPDGHETVYCTPGMIGRNGSKGAAYCLIRPQKKLVPGTGIEMDGFLLAFREHGPGAIKDTFWVHKWSVRHG